jgi:hypothetical protein
MKKLFALLAFAFAASAFAQVTVAPFQTPRATFLDPNGVPLANGCIFTYSGGTSTPLATYTDYTGGTANPNPIPLDSTGSAVIWLSANAYKFVGFSTGGTNCASGVEQWTVDQIQGFIGCGPNTGVVCPILWGGTGATTAQGAAVNIVNGNPIAPSSVNNANVNGIINVAAPPYNALGDCTGSGSTAGCTNNHDAIQRAIDAAYVSGASVFFPSNPSATTQTVYYIATAINPEGVSMFGPPGGSGPGNFYQNTLPVAVRGAPGQDVFALVDAADGGIAPLPSFAMRDFAVIVDDSVDASASFPYRKPGRICRDVVANGTAVITSAAQCLFQPGDATFNQAITVGSTTTTILSYQSPTQVTLATTVPSGTGLNAYISILGLPVTATIGNCGFAYPDRAATAPTDAGPFKSDFTNFTIESLSNSNNVTNTCGFFFQGNESPTWTRWTNVAVSAQWGFAYVPASVAVPTTGIFTGDNDFNTWQNILIYAKYPFLTYGAGDGTISAMQIAFVDAGPQFLTAYGITSKPHNWDIDLREIEPDASCPSANTALRMTGYSNILRHYQVAMCSTYPGTIQWDASGSSLQDLFIGNIAALNITGDQNEFAMPDGGDRLTAYVATTNTGRGNTFITSNSSNPYGGNQPGRAQYYGQQANAFGPCNLSHGGLAFDRRSDFINTGASSYYFNSQDLWMWPDELFSGFGGAGQINPVPDANSETCENFPTVSGLNSYLYGSNGTNFYIGSQIPSGKFRFYAKIASAASTSNWSISLQANEASVWTSIASCATVTGVGTSYQVASCDADATALAGDQFRIILNSATQNGAVAWVAIRPVDSDTLSTSFTLSGGSALTGNQGTGVKLQHSTGNPSTGGMAVYDAAGDTINAVTPSVNAAACWKANGVIGYCSTAVASNGSCTCN